MGKYSTDNLVIFVIGRPGSGKTTFARYVRRALAPVTHRPVTVLNDYDLLVAKLPSLDSSKVVRNGNEFELVDRTVLDDLLPDLSKLIHDQIGKGSIIVEFARHSYVQAFAKLAIPSRSEIAILYLDAPLDLCVQRNATRKGNTVPQSVVEKYFATDDLSELRTKFPATLHVVLNHGVALGQLEREAELVVEDVLGFDSSRSSATAGAPIVAAVLAAYLLSFLSLIVYAWSAKANSFLYDLLPQPSYDVFAKTVLYVGAAGGLGSASYCVRALYHYYILGLFDFRHFKWWYVFRPPLGAVLALASFAVAQGGVAAIGVQAPKSSSNLTWFGIAYLAGFGVEQVIEWLRRASKTLFGESRVQPRSNHEAER